MLITHEREKLINAIVYFANNTRHCGKIKLFELLYLLDFEHFSQTGRSVSGMTYNAWKYGPVPVALAQEWDDQEPDLAAAISIQPEPVIDYTRETVVPRVEFDDRHFSKRELRIMESLANRYRDVFSPKMIDVTHAENGAWDKVWDHGIGFNQPIPYALALAGDAPHRDAILEAADDYRAMIGAAHG